MSPPDPLPLAWSFRTPGPPRGLGLAREKGLALLWDESQWLSLLDRKGERQGHVRLPWPIAAAACADDGSAYAAAGGPGAVWWLAPDLTTRWQRTLDRPVVALALGPFGEYLAATDASAKLHLFDRDGKRVWEAQTPRPLHHLAFVPEAAVLVGAADFGLVAGLDMKGKIIWREGLVVHVGSLATNADGSRIVLACFSDGLRRYTLAGASKESLNLGEPCRLAALSFDGRTTLVAGRASRLLLLDASGKIRRSLLLDAPALAVALSPLGDRAVAALTDGRVVALELGASPRS